MAIEDTQRADDALNLLREAQARNLSPRKASNEEISELLRGAQVLARGKAQGASYDATISALAAALVQEDTRRAARDPEFRQMRQAQIDQLFREKGEDMDESDIKSDRQITREEGEVFGYGNEEAARLAQGDVDREARARQLRSMRMDKSVLDKKIASGGRLSLGEQKRHRYLAKKIYRAEESAKTYAFGLVPIDKLTTADGKTLIDENPTQGVYRPPTTQYELEARRSRNVELAEGRGARAQEERFFRGDLTPMEMERRARQTLGRMDNPLLVTSTPQIGVPDSVVRPDTPEGFNYYREYVPDIERQGVVNISPYQASLANPGNSHAPRELAEIAVTDVQRRAPAQIAVPKPRPDIEGYYRTDEEDIRPQRKMSRHPGVVPQMDPKDAKAALLGELQARKERGRSGKRERIMEANQVADNVRRGLVNTDPQAMVGAINVARTPNVIDLGKARLGAQRYAQGGDYGPAQPYYQGGSDLGLRIGDQNVTLDDAIPVRRPDGSVEWFDATKMAMLGDSKAPMPVAQVATSAGTVNAPISGESAEMFVERNLYDNYGAQFFGDDAIIGNMDAKGSGGGIPQVEISGTLGNLEQLVAKRLGIEPKGIRSVASLQAAADAVIADAQSKGRVMFTMDGGKKVFSETPGLQEVMWDLKVPPAQQKEVANALYQLEASRRQDVNLDSKERFFSGGRATQPAYDGRTMVPGIDNPAQGGDRLAIKKDVAFVNKAIANNATGDAARPFVGQLEGAPTAIQGDTQVFKGQNPTQVREYMEERNRKQRERDVAKAAKKGKKLLYSPTDDRDDVARIRAMQEGNVFTQIRADRDAARREAQGSNDRGNLVPGRTIQVAEAGPERMGRARAPHPKATLLSPPKRPVSPIAPTVVEDGAKHIQLPANYTPGTSSANNARPQGPTMRTGGRTGDQRRDQILNALTSATGLNVRRPGADFEKFVDGGYKTPGKDNVSRFGRRAAIAGGSVALLDTILNMGEEEQYR